jgi:xanthine dehydrogenase YagR molybdenum-binding subunit
MVRSRYYGGMVCGVSFALHEHADVPSLAAILVDEHDPHVNAPGIKGVGEIGVTGRCGRQCSMARDRLFAFVSSRLPSIV